MTKPIITPPAPHALTPREEQIIAMLADGEMGKQIAVKLDVSPRTVDAHLRNIREKLGAKTLVHAVAIWLRARADADRVEYLGLGGIEYLGPYEVDVEFAPIEWPLVQ